MPAVEEWHYAILYSETTLQVQCAQAALLTLLMKFLLASIDRLVLTWTAGKPYVSYVIDVQKKSFRSALRLDIDDRLAYETWQKFWGIGIQHAIGGLLCIPAITGRFYSFDTALVLGRWGALCEVGWEIGDVVERAYQLIFQGERGKQKNPVRLCIMLGIHHVMGMCMVIPMNVYYYDLISYFELVFLLQGAAAVAVFTNQYSMTLNIDDDAELAQMFWLTLSTAFITIFTRLVYYWFVIYKILYAFWVAGSWRLFVAGFTIGGILMPLFGVVISADAVKKLTKFGKLYFFKSQEEGNAKSEIKTRAERTDIMHRMSCSLLSNQQGAAAMIFASKLSRPIKRRHTAQLHTTTNCKSKRGEISRCLSNIVDSGKTERDHLYKELKKDRSDSILFQRSQLRKRTSSQSDGESDD